ncbi:hypothetical protein KTR10_00320 [Candidatus Kaiserbacteria bacterium]|nr:hypothetical protein [Candidatus Kaiserbacteria bacterium]
MCKIGDITNHLHAVDEKSSEPWSDKTTVDLLKGLVDEIREEMNLSEGAVSNLPPQTELPPKAQKIFERLKEHLP